MKTNFKYLTLMAAALLVGFSSCSKDDEAGAKIDETPKSIFLKISNSAPTTYAEGAAQGAALVTFNSGNLYFTDAAGNIKKHFTIGAGATSTTNINMGTLTGTGETITGLPGDVAQVYVVGNTSGLPTAGNISTVRTFARTVASQGTIGDVNLYGTAPITPPTAPATVHEAHVALNPTVARVELTDITATGNVITGFEVAGVFIDNYYTQAVVDGTVNATTNFLFNGPSTTAFTDNSTEYPTALKPFVYDWYATPLVATTLVAKPTAAVWGYNLFATAAGSDVPRIIIRLTNITTTTASGITYTADQYITVKGFKDKASTTSLTGIKAGEVYNIAAGDLTFDETNLTPTPNLNTIDVNVKVTLADWVTVGVTPEL